MILSVVWLQFFAGFAVCVLGKEEEEVCVRLQREGEVEAGLAHAVQTRLESQMRESRASDYSRVPQERWLRCERGQCRAVPLSPLRMDKQKLLELFGEDSDSDDAPQTTHTDAPTHDTLLDQEQDPDPDQALHETDLFSDDDDDQDQTQQQPKPQAPTLHVSLPSLKKPNQKVPLFTYKSRNILKLVATPFDPQLVAPDDDEPGLIDDELKVEGLNQVGQMTYSLRTDNVIRWRDNAETNEMQSNARLVRWSDGSRTLHIGTEVLNVTPKRTGEASHLFARNTKTSLECHGDLNKKVTFQPASISSSTHMKLANQLKRTHVKETRVKQTTTQFDPLKQKEADIRSWSAAQKLQASQTRKARETDESSVELSADFLEADDDEEGDLGAIRRRFKKAGASARNRKPQRRSRAYDDDESDEDVDDRRWDREERLARERGEMDDFIVDGDEDESDEFGGMSDDDEPPPPKKRR